MKARRLLVFAVGLGLVRVACAGAGEWTNRGLAGFLVTALAADPVDPLTVYASGYPQGGGRYTFKSIDGGETWTLIDSSYGEALVVDPKEPSTLYSGGFYEGVRKSLDGGQTWFSADTGMSCLFVRSLALDPENPATLFAGSANTGHTADQCGGLFKSTDSGSTWREVLPGFICCGLAVDPMNSLRVFAIEIEGGAFLGLIRSLDGGDSWTFPSIPPPFPLVILPDRVTENLVYAGTSDGVYVSRDGGETWQSSGLSSVAVGALLIDPTNPATLYAGAGSVGVFRSQDSGHSWSEFNSGLTGFSVTVLAINSTGTRTYAGTNGSGVFVFEFPTRPRVTVGPHRPPARRVEPRL